MCCTEKKEGRALQKKDIETLYQWTENDLLEFKKSFYDTSGNLKGDDEEKPSNSYLVLLAVLFEVWGSLFFAKFDGEQTYKYVEKIFSELLKQDQEKYKIILDKRKIKRDFINLFRNAGVHTFYFEEESKRTSIFANDKNPPVTFNYKEKKWCLNVIILAEDFLRLLKIKQDKIKQINGQALNKIG